MTIRASGVHHLAFNTADMRGQIEFFTDVLGAELVGLFWMHGVPGAKHCFLRLSDHCSLSFVDIPANHGIEGEIGVTHAGTGAGPSAPGTLQHLAFKVDSVEELLGMRDRIRSRGVNVIGHIDHGLCQSIYFGGPEGMTLEVATSAVAIDPDLWIDPEVAALVGLDPDRMDRLTSPTEYEGRGGTVPQPELDPEKPHLAYPPDEYERVLATPDQVIFEHGSYPDPPVQPSPVG